MNEEKDLTLKEAFDLAIQNHQNNNLQDAENYYNRVLKIDPNHNEAKISSIDQFDSTEIEVGLHLTLNNKEREDLQREHRRKLGYDTRSYAIQTTK